MVVCENKDDEHFLAPRSQCVKIPVSNGLGEYRIRDQKCRKIIFKLKKDGRLVDEVIITR
ncbi:MAG: hypothetical protein E7058_10625 [Lentisphaerae bacterium]|nr:hypothetical protein [Lentisphaerota bacterium]